MSAPGRKVVLDTSAVVRLYIPDGPLPEKLIDSISSAEQGNLDLIAPELLSAEFYQVILKKERAQFIKKSEAELIIESFCTLPIIYISHSGILPLALELSRKFNVAIYDALFLSLAHNMKADLVSADEEMLEIGKKVLLAK